MLWYIVGITAAILTSSGFVPQIVKGLRSKKMRDVSMVMIFVWITGTMLWFSYGWHLGDVIIMGANLFTCSCGFLMLVLKVRYGNNELSNKKDIDK